MIDLAEYGWTESLEHEHRQVAADMTPGRVVAEHRNSLRVQTAQAEMVATLGGRLRYEATRRSELPTVGDWVLVDADPEAGSAVIRHVLARSSSFVRKVPGDRTAAQVVAANIDTVWLANALDRPVSLRRIERYVALAWESGARPVILLTKSDLATDIEDVVREVRGVAFGVPVHAVSTVAADGLVPLGEYLRTGRTIALLGSSGAGKSTIVNRLVGEEMLRVNAVRDSDHKGRHTTTHRQLVRVPGGGLLVDTPGMRELQLWDAAGGIRDTFGDIEDLAGGCRFRDCSHTREPGCAVLAAVEAGRLDEGRLESWHKLAREQAWLDRRADPLARRAETREIREIMRSLRYHPKYRRDR